MSCVRCHLSTDDGPTWDTNGGGELCFSCLDRQMGDAAYLHWIEPDGTIEEWRVLDDLTLFNFERRDGVTRVDERPAVIEGYEKVLDGWTTAWTNSETVRKKRLNEWCCRLVDGEITPPVSIGLFIESTSNVFTHSLGVYVKSEEQDVFMEWLLTSDVDVREAIG